MVAITGADTELTLGTLGGAKNTPWGAKVFCGALP